jgi:PIN domain nuclease of toxin-antitoxin system
VRILLDTCTFLWIAAGSPRLSDRAADLCSDPANDVHLSAVTAWEIAVKHALGKLPLPGPPSVFVPEARVRLSFAQLPLSEAVAVSLERLPRHHDDPADRLLICQALLGEMTIVTPDPKIRQYPVATEW